MSLTFEPIEHRYTWNGIVVPSVTQALKAANILDYRHIPQDILQRAAIRGTAAHKACELWDLETLNEETLDEEIRPYLEAYKRFTVETGWIPGRIEERHFNRTYTYAGTFDRIGLLNGALVCLDFKTGMVMDGHRAQLAAYCMMMPQPRRFQRIALQLKSDATYKVHPFPIRDLSLDFNKFLGALSDWRKLNPSNPKGQAA